MTFVLGLTGSVGMGKSATAALFAAQGLPVWDADAAVHRLYAAGGAAVAVITALFPAAVVNGSVSRPALRAVIAANPAALARIEWVVHPLVAQDRAEFLRRQSAAIVVLDIPLLYETGADAQCNAIAVVSTSADIQRARVMARPGMTEAAFALILSRQLPDADKRARADYVIDTTTPETAQADVAAIIQSINTGLLHA